MSDPYEISLPNGRVYTIPDDAELLAKDLVNAERALAAVKANMVQTAAPDVDLAPVAAAVDGLLARINALGSSIEGRLAALEAKKIDVPAPVVTVAPPDLSAVAKMFKPLEETLKAIKSKPDAKFTSNNSDVVEALRQVNDTLIEGFERMREAQLAKTVLITDDLDDPVAARKVL